MSNVNVDFGNLAEKIIQQQGMTKKAVSKMAGIPYSTLNFLLSGDRSPKLDDILKIAEATRMPPSAFIPSQFTKRTALAGGEQQ